MSTRFDLGAATAYAYAVDGGYTGTEAEFIELLGNIAQDLEEIENLSVTVTTLPAGSSATASYADGVLSLGIPKGDKGDKGNTGATGPTGATPDISIGTVTTGAVGSDAAATMTGTPEHPVLNLTLPRGATGDVTNLADTFSSSKAYTAGEYVIYNDLLYVFTANHAAGAWNASHVSQVKVGGELTALKEDLGLRTEVLDMSSYSTIGVGMQSGNYWAGIGDTNFKSALITGSYESISVTANSNGSTFISFFSKVPSEPETQLSEIYFCNGETGRHQVSTGTTARFNVPVDCVCIVVGTLINSSDRTPTILGTSIADGGIIDDIYNDIDDTSEEIYRNTQGGETTISKSDIGSTYQLYSTDWLYQLSGLTVNVSKINNINKTINNGAKAFIIPLENVQTLTYPVFKSSADAGSFIFDENDTIIWMYTETVADTGTEKTITIPPNASYMLLSISAGLMSLDWDVTLVFTGILTLSEDIRELSEKVELIDGRIVTKDEAVSTDVIISSELLYILDGVQPGVTTLDEVTTSGTGGGGYALKVPLDGVKSIAYPVFKSSSNAGSLMFDENDVVTWFYSETSATTGTLKTVNVPKNTKYMLLSISGSLDLLDWSYTLYALPQDIDVDADSVTPFKNENRNMCLAATKTDILSNKIPYHRGYLFHKLQNNDFSMWYGEDFDHIHKIGSVTFSPNYWRFAISPKDGRIISVKRDDRSGLYVWDGTTETFLNSFQSNPQAWLYNSGIDFINDGSDEYCVFAEYSGSVASGYDLHVWRGKYPYTSASDWSIVMTKTQVTDITHFHMVRRDPWTNILYLTAGDSSAESKWWYSTDKGATWTLLVSGTDTGWGNSLCRTINFIFTKDYIYWATDHGEADAQHHTLNRIARDSDTGIMDLSTKEQLALLPQLYATNSLCYVESPNGLFMYDRIDVGSSSVFGEPIKMMFWDFATEELVEVASLKLTVNDWGGSRGKCYLNYTNGRQPMPAMGFSIDTPCIFDLVCDNPSNIGTIAYDVGSKTIRTIDY